MCDLLVVREIVLEVKTLLLAQIGQGRVGNGVVCVVEVVEALGMADEMNRGGRQL
jgi:hypothetical protein